MKAFADTSNKSSAPQQYNILPWKKKMLKNCNSTQVLFKMADTSENSSAPQQYIYLALGKRKSLKSLVLHKFFSKSHSVSPMCR